MNTIHFKSGKKLKITPETAQQIGDSIRRGCNQFQVFSTAGKYMIVINLYTIEFIN